MKMTRQPLICALSLAAVLALSACSGHNDESATPAPAPNTAPASTAMAPPAASTAMTPPASSTAAMPPSASTAAMAPPSASTAGHQ
jgi:hypothetical protein